MTAMSPENSPFRPFETHLDEEAALSVLRDAVAGADDGELFLERRRAEVLSFDDGRLRTASYDSSQGFGLRTVLGGAAGYAHASELSEAALRRAAETARMAARDGHFQPLSLLESQFDPLESPAGEANAVSVDIVPDTADVIAAAALAVRAHGL